MKKFRWDKKYLYCGVTAFCVIVCSLLFFQVLSRWNGVSAALNNVVNVLSPFIAGFIIAYILNDVVIIFEKHVFSKLCGKIFKTPRGVKVAARAFSIILTYILALGIVAGLLVLILPQIYWSVVDLVGKSSTYINVAIDWLESINFENTTLESTAISWINSAAGSFVTWIETNFLPQMSNLITSITGGVISIIKAVFNLFVGLIISIYMLFSKDTLCAQGKKILYCVTKRKTANAVLDELRNINDAFGNYITGTLIDALIVGVATYIFMLIVGMPYTALITIIIAVTNIIPVFGPFIGAIPSAMLLILENPTYCLLFVIFIVVLQQLDGNVIKPLIHGNTSGLSGFWVMFAILFFGGLFGLPGMIIGIPLLSVIYNIIRRLVARGLKRKSLPEDTEYYIQTHRLPLSESSNEESPDDSAGEEGGEE